MDLSQVSPLLSPRHRVWRDTTLPRLVVPLYWISALCLVPAVVIGWLGRALSWKGPQERRGEARVVVESGQQGWNLIEFQERLHSLTDYLDSSRVTPQEIDRSRSYTRQFLANQGRDEPTHVILDMRTPHQSWLKGGYQALRVSWYLLSHNITPVVFLPDFFYRRLRWHASVLTAYRGAVVTLTDPSSRPGFFPHRRILGPTPLPISVGRFKILASRPKKDRSEVQVNFVGQVYPPREEFLEHLQQALLKDGISIHIYGEKWTTSNDDYWRLLKESDVVINTGFQGPERNFVDHIWEPHMVYRVHEVLAAGAALVTSRVAGSDLFFRPGTDFLEFDSVAEAANHVRALASDRVYLNNLKKAGHEQSRKIIHHGVIWHSVDNLLKTSTWLSYSKPLNKNFWT